MYPTQYAQKMLRAIQWYQQYGGAWFHVLELPELVVPPSKNVDVPRGQKNLTMTVVTKGAVAAGSQAPCFLPVCALSSLRFARQEHNTLVDPTQRLFGQLVLSFAHEAFADLRVRWLDLPLGAKTADCLKYLRSWPGQSEVAIRDVGGVAGCFSPSLHEHSWEPGAYQGGELPAKEPACLPKASLS